jgi:hypothetical protein
MATASWSISLISKSGLDLISAVPREPPTGSIQLPAAREISIDGAIVLDLPDVNGSFVARFRQW